MSSAIKTIGWLQISAKKYGGVVYNQEAVKALSKEYDAKLFICEPKLFKNIRYFRVPESLFIMSRLKEKKDLWVRDFYSTIAMPFLNNGGKNIVIIHHDDFSGLPLISKPFFWALRKIFYMNLKKNEAVVTVSEYWKNYFLKKGCKNVFKIYNSFKVQDFNVTAEEVEKFKKEKNLIGKPIIYLGNCQKAKGVVGAYSALKDLDAYLVTSGRKQAKIPALNFDLDYKDYLKLLKASSVVLTMSRFREGWCRTAHEAMLLRVPVIGSGLGGMKELLEGGKQIVCEDFSELYGKVEFLLKNPKIRLEMGENGYNFAKNFTMEKFNNEWLKLIKEI